MEHGVNGSDPRVKRTRRLLMQAFTELAAEKDIRAITVQDIAGRATLNRATFYAHFRDKDALLDAAFRERTREMLSAKLTPASPLTRDNLCSLFCIVCEILNTMVRRCPRSLGEDHRVVKKLAVQEELHAFILEWLQEGLPDKRTQRFPLDALATLVSWSLFGASVEWASNPTKHSREAMVAQVVDLLLEGLRTSINVASSIAA